MQKSVLVVVMSLFSFWGCPRSGESVDIGLIPDHLLEDASSGDQLVPMDLLAVDGPLADVNEPAPDLSPLDVPLLPGELISSDLVVPTDLTAPDDNVTDLVDGQCLPACQGKECGPDGCGGLCGKCPDVAPVCGDDGMCQFECQPDCADKECGPDGCNGSCGECDGGNCADGLCQPDCPAPECQQTGQKVCAGETTYQTCLAPEAPCETSLYLSAEKDCLAGTLCVDGECLATDPCEVAASQGSHFGCSFWSVDLAVYPDPYVDPQPDLSPHALYFAAPDGESVTISFATAASGVVLATTQTTLCGGCASALTLPVMSLSGGGIFDRSVHITSDRPITVAQVNPEDAMAAVSDVSLLWPEHLLDTNYAILTWPTEPIEQMPFPGLPSQHGYFAVVATAPGTTEVSLTLPVAGKALTDGGELLAAGQLHTVTLAQHEVLQVLADGSTQNGDYDLSGATVAADHPVVVFSGHEEASVCYEGPQDSCCADHIEAQLVPESLWGFQHLCIKAPPRSGSDKDVWRILAGNAGALLSTSPVITGVDGVTLAPGQWVEVITDKSFSLVSSKPVQVAHYLVGRECSGGSIGDPALIMTVPKSGYSTDFHAPLLPGYLSTTAVVVRPVGAVATIAGNAISQPFEVVGLSGYERAYVPLPAATWFKIPQGGMVTLYGYNAVAGYGLPLGATF